MDVRLTPRLAAAVGVTLVLLVILVGWFLLISPQRSKASSLSGQITDAQSQLTLALAQARTLRRDAPARKAQLAALKLAVPADVQMSGILRQLSATAAAAGVRVDTITPQAVGAGSGFETVPLSVVAEGRYFGIMNFVHLLRTKAEVNGSKVRATGRLFQVGGLQFGGGATAGASDLLSVTMTIDAYVSTPATATPAAVPATSVSSAPAGTASTAAGTTP